ncbi:MAG: hypothetical protein ABI075_02930 [Burkholderiaceae bacterium]
MAVFPQNLSAYMQVIRPHSNWHLHLGIRLLVLALLFAQWNGFNHRIQHAFWQQLSGISTFSQANTDGSTNLVTPHHSCLDFDAATLAVTIYSAPFVGPTLPNVQVLALWIAFASWTAPFTRHFLSRAPPAV